AWAEATDTRRSVFVPPKRMVIRIIRSALSSFRDVPKAQTRNLFSLYHFEIPGSRCAHPGMTTMPESQSA
ncbi:MAG TPA: hypothetical protein VEN78_33860, partial [Bradyrhizobium sp.]|nr:hypothetical protein [Bradyrhizobium sp.]